MSAFWLRRQLYRLILVACSVAAACVPPSADQPAMSDPAGARPLPRSEVKMAGDQPPTLVDYWNGRAHFVVDEADTGLPMGESDTVPAADGLLWSYVHASERSAGVVDHCGAPVPFPGCVLLFESSDAGRTFALPQAAEAPSCLIPCAACPCRSDVDHIDQQQYPRVVVYTTSDGPSWVMAYEYRGSVMLRRSRDGRIWSSPEAVPFTGTWQRWYANCRPEERIGPHPHAAGFYDCLVGGPPGLIVVPAADGTQELYLFVAAGQNPSSMSCYRGPADGPAALLRRCRHNPLFTGAATYGPVDVTGRAANAFFDFRTISSAEIVRVGERFYMLYEGVRGPTAGDAGDTQFGLGLARSLASEIDGPWEVYVGSPLLVDLPGNIGLGHADLIVIDGETVLFTSLDGQTRSRLRLVWK